MSGRNNTWTLSNRKAYSLRFWTIPDPKTGDGVKAPKPPEEAPDVVSWVTPNTLVAVPLPKREVPDWKAGDGVLAPKPPKEAPNVVGCVTPNTLVAVPLPKMEVPDPEAGDGLEAHKPLEEAPNVVGCVTPNTPVAVPLPKGKVPVWPPHTGSLAKVFAPNGVPDWFIPNGFVVVPTGFEAADVAPNGELLDGAPKAERHTNRNRYQLMLIQLTSLIMPNKRNVTGEGHYIP